MAVMDKRVNELRDRLWKKKAALQQKENLPVSEWASGRASGRAGKQVGERASKWVSGQASGLFGLGPGRGSCILRILPAELREDSAVLCLLGSHV